MKATANLASGADTAAGAASAAATAAGGPFVLNLCSSTTPMALAQTDLPELKRFSFFVSRRFEEGRERFRLHMGYFATLAEAEEWLNLVREIYPGAWAGEAPGRKLRERAAAAAAAQAQHAAGPQTQAAAAPAARMPSAPRVAPAPAPIPRAAAPIPVARVPVLHAPSLPAHAAVARAQAQSPARAAAASPATRRTPPRSAAPPAPAAAPSAHSPLVQSLLAQQGEAAKAPAPAAPAEPPVAAVAPAARAPDPTNATTIAAPPLARTAGRARGKRVFEDSNVREVLHALSDASPTGETRQMMAPPPALPVPEPTVERGALSDTQVLKLLETRRTDEPPAALPAPAGADGGDGVIQLLKPDDTGTREALKDAVASNAPVAFAVQLQWSVQAIELGNVPPLAIFSAYTLYTVEGSRDGRRWYGLRLGFFSDAISAKQVAHYVRSEFASVAVVPVSPQEKVRATAQDAAAMLAAPVPVRADPVDEFKLIDEPPVAPAPASQPAPAAAAGTARRPVPRTARGARAGGARTGGAPAAGKVGARERRGPQTLEETLEILGASELSIDDGRGGTISDTGVRHLRVEVQAKNSPFSRLLDRLSERLKKP